MSGYCRDHEGWGPTSAERVDMTLCFESSILSTLPAILATFLFVLRMNDLRRFGKAHNLGRTNIIYWPCQVLMIASAVALIARAGIVSGQSSEYASPAVILANVSMAVAWIFATILNHFEHQYEIRSSTTIFAYYVVSIIGSAITARTLSSLPDPTSTANVFFYLFLAFNILGFIVEAWPRGRTAVQKASEASAYEKANLGSRYSFHYLQATISKGYRTPLKPEDIQQMMPKRIRTQYSFVFLSERWEAHVRKRQAKGKEPNLMWLILSSYGTQWVPILAYKLLGSALTFVAPELLDRLLSFTNSYSGEEGVVPQPALLGIILAFGMFFSTMTSALLEGQFVQLALNVGIEARTALVSMIYRKALKLSPFAKQSLTPGEISNHMSVDSDKWGVALDLLPMWISVPFEICLALWLLYRQLGWSSMAGLATIIAVSPLQGYIAAFFSKAKDEKLAAMDNRIRLVNEVLAGIKIVKLYGWESSFRSKIAVYRNRELAILRKIGLAFSFMTIMFSSLTLLMALVSFSIYATVGGPGGAPGDINAQTIFVSLTLFGLLNRPIGMLSFILGETVGLVVANRRIQRYLLSEELDESEIERHDTLPEKTSDSAPVVIQIQNATFAWDKEGPEVETDKQEKARVKKEARKYKEQVKEALESGLPTPSPPSPVERNYDATLTDINLSVPMGHLTAIVGRVGQGKTSLFSAMIGDMYKRQGSVKIYGRVAYAPQQTWIINATLKDNIVFGLEFDQERYDRIVYASGLLPDIEMLPAGDLTEIGERGINLSGGQKQRVSLARAAYQDADIYLLDDPLSAVDAHVDQHLWQNLIGPNGLLKDKTRMLVTHGIHHLSEVDQIVVIKDGEISEVGQYQELLDAKNAFFKLIEDYSAKETRKDSESATSMDDALGDGTMTLASDDDIVADGKSKGAVAKHGAVETSNVVDEKLDDKADLIDEEHLQIGNVRLAVYKIYAKAASYRNAIQVLLLFGVIQGCQIGTTIWLQQWVGVVSTTTHGVGFFMGIYAVLVFAYMMLTVWTSYTTMVSAGVRASQRLHNNLLNNVLRLPMSFFDTTPVGRIVNRFSSDFYSIDEVIPWGFHDMIFCGIATFGSLIVIGVATPWFLAIVPPVMVAYVVVQSYYIASSRAFKRIESITKSPMYQHFSETLAGVSTIRAMRYEARFIDENATKSNLTSNSHFIWAVGNRWINVRLELLGSIIVLASALFAVMSRNTLSASVTGMSLSYALNITQDITWMVRCYCELQNNLVSVERVKEYSDKHREAPNETTVNLPPNWPAHGKIEFKNYSTRYRQGMDLVIKNVSFDVQPGEKIGIVGRTGAGKSSLTLALFRIIEAANMELEKIAVEEDGGSIWIDGVDISTIGLEALRQNLAIIPQDPTLFVGTVRDNLDPFEQCQDAELWEALERAHLKMYISSKPGGLSYEVTQNGENFSVGQRSLICLARALLRKTKILVLDEATAAVDVETDELIQKTIRSEFADRTILTIAHRIKTVMDYDKILVLEKGRVQEYESPETLLQHADSLFYNLAQQAGEIKSSD
ncbi:Canalicular multispecific organic anion transporter 2 [Podila minutissima]|nr:Canalicular multispecific organic anion transporter 2 [Podila minutissima]